MRVLVTEPGTSRAFPLRTVFLVSPAASSSATSLATSSTPEFAARLLQPLPKRPQVPASFARRRALRSRTSRNRDDPGFAEPENMAGPILASTYKRWRVLIAKAEQEPALVDVLDFSDFSDVHGHGALEEILPMVKGIREPPPRIPNNRSKGAAMERIRQPTTFSGSSSLGQTALRSS